MTYQRPSAAIASDARDRLRGCLLGGAVGDALGAPVEFMSLAEIRARFGPAGIQDFAPAYGRMGAITDDTQMTLFTAEAMLRAMLRSMIRGISGAHISIAKRSYLRWLETQGCALPEAYAKGRDPEERGWLLTHPELHSQRAPGATCMSALMQTEVRELRASNDSKGCGGVMRVAPAAMIVNVIPTSSESDALAFEIGSDLAAITHGHPTGQVAAGAFAVVVLAVLQGADMKQAVDRALSAMPADERSKETSTAMQRAIRLSNDGTATDQAIRQLGEGWVAEEALAIALYCALVARDFASGVRMAVNIDGDSDSTGSLTGNLLGALHGEGAIPRQWLDELELRDVIVEMADDFLLLPSANIGDYGDRDANDYWWQRYPGF